MSDSEDSPAGSDGDSDSTTNNGVGGQNQPNQVKLKACDIEVTAQSTEMDVDEMVEQISPEMKTLMEYHLRGEYEVLEEQRDLPEQIGTYRRISRLSSAHPSVVALYKCRANGHRITLSML